MHTAALFYLGYHAQDTRQPRPVARGKATGQELELAHGFVDEGAKESAQVKRIVDREAIEQHQILIALATADVVAGREVVCRHDTGEQLHHAQHIRLADDGYTLEGFPPHAHDARAAGQSKLVALRGECRHLDGLQLLSRGDERDGERGGVTSAHHDRHGIRAIADATYDYAHVPRGHSRQEETTVVTRHGAESGSAQHDGSRSDGRRCGRVHDSALHHACRIGLRHER